MTREYQHSVMSLLEGARAGFDGLRGGYGTADHVDIMGNHHVLFALSYFIFLKFFQLIFNIFFCGVDVRRYIEDIVKSVGG